MVITKVIDQSVPPGSCGTVRDGFHARLVDEEGRDVPPGTIGELIVRSGERTLMLLGYQGDPVATEEAWRDGWYHTGDAVSVDENGFYYFHDRYKDSLRRRGENISSFEVEREVLAFPGIDEVACVAHPGEYAGDDEVKVFIVPEPGRQIRLAEVVESPVNVCPRSCSRAISNWRTRYPRHPHRGCASTCCGIRGTVLRPMTG